MPAVSEDMLSLGEAAVALREQPAATFARVARGQLAGRKVGRIWYVDRASLSMLLAESRTEPQPAA